MIHSKLNNNQIEVYVDIRDTKSKKYLTYPVISSMIFQELRKFKIDIESFKDKTIMDNISIFICNQGDRNILEFVEFTKALAVIANIQKVKITRKKSEEFKDELSWED